MSATQTEARRAPTIPTTMRAVAIDRFGPPDVLTPRTVLTPIPGPREVLIELYSAGVGIWDARARDGSWAEGRERFPKILGTDGAGVVVATGSRVEGVRLFEEVWAYEYDNPKGGFYAEYVAVSAENVGRKPPRLGLLEAGAAAVTGLTALQGIDDHLEVRHRETVLVFGASGAVGTLAVQFAKRHLAHVIGTASGPAAQTAVRELGADHVLDARAEGAEDMLRRIAPKGLDAVLALAGGHALERCLTLLRDGGRVAYPNGVEPEPRKRSGVRTIAYDAEVSPRKWDDLSRATEEARLRVPLAAVFPLEQAARAHERIEQGHVVGRIALRIRDDPPSGPIAPLD
jgi:NADPH:quinone reductase-like Zn-dependent oxidoreductase